MVEVVTSISFIASVINNRTSGRSLYTSERSNKVQNIRSLSIKKRNEQGELINGKI